MHSTEYDFPQKGIGLQQDAPHETASLTPREALELFENAVDNAQQGLQSMAENARVTEMAKAKLTLDLRHCRLDRIPPEVAEIIKQDVERWVSSSFQGSCP